MELPRTWMDCLLQSYRKFTGTPFPIATGGDVYAAVHHAPFALLSHDASAEPRFVYVNAMAEKLWQYNSGEMIGMESRFSAEPDQRETRARFLEEVNRQGFARGYTGVRISRHGQRFTIIDAMLWNVEDNQERKIGQAAMFYDWQQL